MRTSLKPALAGACAALLLGLWLLHATSAQAQAAPLPANVGSGDCDRACLQDLAEQFIAALLAHDPGKVALAKGVRYSENSVPLPIPDGFWKNATGVRNYRLYVADPEWGTIGFYARMYQNGDPVILSARLKVYNHQLTEIETIVTTERGRIGPAATASNPTDYLGERPRPEYTQVVPPAQRRTREELMKIVNTYFTGIENNAGDRPPRFSAHCQRLENGRPTSNVPLAPGQERGGINMSCAEDLATGYHRNDNRIRSRRIMAVDLEHQVVMTSVYFDHENDAPIRSYVLKNGKTVTVADPGPSTLQAHETFSIDREGVSQVEAVFTNVTYGTRPYFTTGWHMDSPQAVKDGFDEYER
ncbi:MAG TPA: hypothetical protein VK700_04330 [Steroidobacteraceae bacterium]|jgi:hypothetical protein|nr:hypothetical protein [Steroidobacteraceae bacterium]